MSKHNLCFLLNSNSADNADNGNMERSDSNRDRQRATAALTISLACNKCGSVLASISNLNRHIRTVHENQLPYKCMECDKEFGQKTCLNTHIRTVHEGKRPYKCDQCAKEFGQKSNRNTHIRTVHKKQRPFKCELCNKAFGEKGNLRKHQRSVHFKMKSSNIKKASRYLRIVMPYNPVK